METTSTIQERVRVHRAVEAARVVHSQGTRVSGRYSEERVDAPVAVEAAQPKRGRGRPPGSKNKRKTVDLAGEGAQDGAGEKKRSKPAHLAPKRPVGRPRKYPRPEEPQAQREASPQAGPSWTRQEGAVSAGEASVGHNAGPPTTVAQLFRYRMQFEQLQVPYVPFASASQGAQVPWVHPPCMTWDQMRAMQER